MTRRGWLTLVIITACSSIPPLLFLFAGVHLDDLVITISGSIGVLAGYTAGQLMFSSRLDYLERNHR